MTSFFRKKEFQYLLLAVVFIFLIVPRPSHAVFVDEVTALFTAMGDGTEDTFNPIATKLIDIFFWYLAGIALLYISAYLLQFILINSPAWLTLSGSGALWIQSGWNFIAGITNAFLIIIFLVIAFAYILKIETIDAKKTLPKLIIVALLVNFSLVFVKIIIDISNVFYRTIVTAAGGANANFIFDIVNLIGLNAWTVFLSLIVFLAATAVALLIPFTMPFVELAVVLGIVSTIFLPNIVMWIAQIFLFYAFGGLFLTTAFLLAARVFIIQILAVISPLAFLCAVLPQTKKYWDEWLEHLVQWAFYGVVLFFLLLIGSKAMAMLTPAAFNPMAMIATMGLPGVIFSSVAGFVIYYFFLFVFFAVAMFVSAKFAPIMAKTLIAQATDLSKKVTGQVGALGKATIKKARQEGTGDFIASGDQGVANFRRRLESVPLIGRSFGGPGAYDAAREKQIEAQKKKLGTRTNAQLRQIAEQRLPGNQSVAAYEILASKGATQDADIAPGGVVHRLIPHGLDRSTTTDARPDWAPAFSTPAVPRTVQQAVEGSKVRAFREKTQAEAFDSWDVFRALDRAKVEDINRSGSRQQKTHLRDFVRDHDQDIRDELARLITSGIPEDMDRADRLADVADYVNNNYIV